MFSSRQIILLLTPPLLLATTYLAYRFLVPRLGRRWGYLGGFLFYWLGWCLILPVVLLSPRRLGNLFRVALPGLGRPWCLGLSFLIIPLLLGLLWGWVAYASVSIAWTVVSHVLFDFSGLGARVYFANR